MLGKLNEQVEKQIPLRDGVLDEIAEIDKECAWLMDDKHPKKGATGFPNLIQFTRLQKRKTKLEKSLEERQRVLDGKVRRRDEWLSEKRVVASERAEKVRTRVAELDGLEGGIWSYGSNGSEVVERLVELTDEAERKYKALVAMKELAVMLEDVFDGRGELVKADPELVEVIFGAFEEG